MFKHFEHLNIYFMNNGIYLVCDHFLCVCVNYIVFLLERGAGRGVHINFTSVRDQKNAKIIDL